MPFTALGGLARQTGAEFVVVSGDVFDARQSIGAKVVSQSLEAMRAIDVPVFLLPGSHDPMDASSVYTSTLFAAGAPATSSAGPPGVWEVRPGVQLVAAPWYSKAPTSDLAAAALDGMGPADGVRILVAHGGVDVLDPDPPAKAIAYSDEPVGGRAGSTADSTMSPWATKLVPGWMPAGASGTQVRPSDEL